MSVSTKEQELQHRGGAGKTIYHLSSDNYFETHSDSMDKRKKDRGWKKKKKKHQAFICPALIPHSGWLILTVQYRHVEMATLIDVPAPHIFHSPWQIMHNSTALAIFLSSPQYNTPWTMVLVYDLFINIS